jgi:hypothetical protein
MRFLEEGEQCPECSGGRAVFKPVENCSCHISAPCSACVDNTPECDTCGAKEVAD